MVKSNFHIRELTSADLDQYNALLRYAFQVTEKNLQDYGWEEDDIKQSKFPILERADVWGCFDDKTLVSQFAVYPLKMNVHSAVYPIGFVTSVATYPEYSGMGLMSKLMKRGLTEMRKNGQSLSLLYPYSIPLYRNRGWEIISDKMSYRIRDIQLPRHIEVPGYVRRVSWDNTDFMTLHTRFANQTHGCLYRNRLAWEEYWRWIEDDTAVAIYYNADDKPQGYMVYLIKDDVMYIRETIYLNSEARKGLLKYISAHESMVNEVRGSNYFSEPVAFSLDDSDIKETIRPYIMGRIVDVAMFLENYRCDPDVTGKITLHITDSFLEWNDKSFTLAFSGGKVTLAEGGAPHEASMSIGTLTTLLLGYKRATELARLERITASDAALRLLDNVLIAEKPYISDYI